MKKNGLLGRTPATIFAIAIKRNQKLLRMQATTSRKKFHENNSINAVGSKPLAVCSSKILIINVLRKLKTVYYSKAEALNILVRAKASGKAKANPIKQPVLVAVELIAWHSLPLKEALLFVPTVLFGRPFLDKKQKQTNIFLSSIMSGYK